MILKNFAVKFCVHNAIKNAGKGCTIPAHSSPHMNLHRLFWAGFRMRFLAFLSAAKPSVCLHLYRCLVGPDNFFETSQNILLRPAKSLVAVVCTDKLTISCTTDVHPSNRRALSAVNADTDTPIVPSAVTSSFAVVSSSCNMASSTVSNTASLSFVGLPDLGKGIIVP